MTSEQVRETLREADFHTGPDEAMIATTVRIQDALAAMIVVELRRVADNLDQMLGYDIRPQ